MQQRQFQFHRSDGEPLAIKLACRAPPEEQAGRTLTWQIGGGKDSGAESPEPSANAVGGAEGAPPAAPDLIGLDIWPASIALCRYLAAHPQLVEGVDVLELGAGGQHSASCRSSVLWSHGFDREWPSRFIASPAERCACSARLSNVEWLAALQAWVWWASLPRRWAPAPCCSPITSPRCGGTLQLAGWGCGGAGVSALLALKRHWCLDMPVLRERCGGRYDAVRQGPTLVPCPAGAGPPHQQRRPERPAAAVLLLAARLARPCRGAGGWATGALAPRAGGRRAVCLGSCPALH